KVVENANVAEKMIRKLRAGMMPPPQARRPDAATIQSFYETLENTIDAAAALKPNPGWRPFQRLNRAEYQRAVRDLLGIDVDVTAYLPPDTVSSGFDNVADEQTFSPALLEGYLRAASQISRLAVGDRNAGRGGPPEETPTRTEPEQQTGHRGPGRRPPPTPSSAAPRPAPAPPPQTPEAPPAPPAAPPNTPPAGGTLRWGPRPLPPGRA